MVDAAQVPEGLPRPNWLVRLVQAHARAFFFTLGTLVRNPVGSLLTALVIGVTLALPAGFHLALQRAAALGYSWEGSLQISLFLKDSVSEARGRELTRELGKRKDVGDAQYISREQSLQEFRALSGFGEALEVLESNPLPAVIAVTPAATVGSVSALATELGKLPDVDAAKFDQEWLERLQALLEFARRVVWVTAALLALAVVVIVGNTIRLDLQSRREEIAVMKLIGASDAFIRRPFLYAGLWYGIAGGVLAWLLVFAGQWLLAGPAQRIFQLYGLATTPGAPPFLATLAIIGAGLILGLTGAQLTVSRHLSAIEPE
jgi:cell division transport system permease protein